MVDINRLLNKFVESGLAGGMAGGLATSAVANVMTGKKKGKKGKKGKKVASSALKLGGLALVGGLAYKAYQHYKEGQMSGSKPALDTTDTGNLEMPPSRDGTFLPATEDATSQSSRGMLLVQAMIAAAKADGQIDAGENQRIFSQLQQLDLAAEEKAFLLEEFGKPLNIDALVKAVDSPEVAAEVYTASLLAVDTLTPAEKAYLDMLAARLNLDQALVQELHTSVSTVHTIKG